MAFSEWLLKQFTGFNVLTMIIIVLFNYLTTTRAVNRQMKEQKLYEELDEIKEEINRATKKD
jgi:glucosamine 6-phosphate synthetase-like amidotransferase/phosphosugar isomerase protein